MELEVRQLTAEEFSDALALRMEVFVDEQKVPPEEEHDALDATATHFGTYDGKPSSALSSMPFPFTRKWDFESREICT